MLKEYASLADAVKIKILCCDFLWNDGQQNPSRTSLLDASSCLESRKQALPLSEETVVFAENVSLGVVGVRD